MPKKENSVKKKQNQIDPDSILRDLCRQWWGILLTALTAMLFTGTYMKLSYTPQYSTSTVFVVEMSGFSTNSISDNLRSAESMVKNFTVIADSSVLKNRVCKDLGISSFSAKIRMSSVESSNLITMTVVDDTSRMSYLTCLSVMKCAQELCDELAENISIRVLQQPSIPSYPSNSLSLREKMLKAALAAAVIMALLFAWISICKDTIKNEREMSQKLDAPLLASINHEKIYKTPIHRIRKKRNSLCLENLMLSFNYVESIRLMATRVRLKMEKNSYKTIMVTSVSENEGKSTIAANLALALAQEGYSAVLLDCDFRKPSQYKIFDLQNKTNKMTDFREVIRQKKALKLRPIGRDQKLKAAFSLTPHRHTLDRETTAHLNEILEQLKTEYDYVIIDSSPLGLVAEGETLANLADASLLVVQQDFMEAKHINDMIDQLNHTKSTLLGCIYNNVRPGIISQFISESHYGYGKGYYGANGKYSKYGKYGKYGHYEKTGKSQTTETAGTAWKNK